MLYNHFTEELLGLQGVKIMNTAGKVEHHGRTS